MAEWLGELMVGWPTWLIGVVAVVIFIAGAAIMIYWSNWIPDEMIFWRSRHDKK